MSHLIVIVITLISTITVGKQQGFIFQGTWLTFGALLLPCLAHLSWQLSKKHQVHPPRQGIWKYSYGNKNFSFWPAPVVGHGD